MSPEWSKTLETSPLGSKLDKKRSQETQMSFDDVAAPDWATCHNLRGPRGRDVAAACHRVSGAWGAWRE